MYLLQRCNSNSWCSCSCICISVVSLIGGCWFPIATVATVRDTTTVIFIVIFIAVGNVIVVGAIVIIAILIFLFHIRRSISLITSTAFNVVWVIVIVVVVGSS